MSRVKHKLDFFQGTHVPGSEISDNLALTNFLLRIYSENHIFA